MLGVLGVAPSMALRRAVAHGGTITHQIQAVPRRQVCMVLGQLLGAAVSSQKGRAWPATAGRR